MEKTYKYRAYPSKEQQSILNLQMRLAKGLYNRLLDQSQRHFKDTGKTFTKYDMNKWISKFKKENPEYDQCILRYCRTCQTGSSRRIRTSSEG